MKNRKLLSVLCSIFIFGTLSAQEIIRTDFLQIGDQPFRQNITRPGVQGFSMRTVSTESFDEDVKNEIKAQKKDGFKTVDKANLLFGIMRTLDSPYPVEAGMIYRIITISDTQRDTFVLRALKEDGSLAVPEVQFPGDYRDVTLRAQLDDYAPTKNGMIRLQNLTMSMNANEYSAVRYLIFKKKAK